ncbi:MAG: tyrosine-protein phosphatase [Actinomycetota bacterium]
MTAQPLDRVGPQLDGVYNFRDLAGVAPAPIDGRPLAPGRLFRSDGLHRAPIDQQSLLLDVPVANVIDLRTSAEIEREGRFSADGITWRHAPILESLADFLSADAGDGSVDLLCRHYEHMIAANAEALAMALGAVADSVERGPTVFHCTAGKDRTGVVAALVLASVGVDDDAIAADFASSAAGIDRMVAWYRRNTDSTPADKMAEMGLDPAMAPIVMGAEAATMVTFLDRLRAANGGIRPYLASIGAVGSVDRITAALLA